MITNQSEIEFSANEIGKIDSGEKHIFLENINTENEYDSKVFYHSNMAGVFFSCVYYGYLRIHIAFAEDTDCFNEEICSLINATINKSPLKAGSIWIKNDNHKIIEYIKKFFKIVPDFGEHYYASEEFIMRQENFTSRSEPHPLTIKPFEDKELDEYLSLLDHSMTFACPPPNYLINRDRYSKLFDEKRTENSFEAFWNENELVGLYWRDGAEIDIMAVSANLQRRGYGTIILSRTIDIALKNTEKDFVYLYAVDWNEKGRAFYRKYGMELNAHSYGFKIENFRK